jgi:hypothetical protein
VVAAPGTGTCTANVRFIPQAQGARSTTLRFADDPGSAVTVQGTGGAPTQGADGADGSDGADGTDGADGADGTNGTAGVDGTAGTDGAQGAEGAQGLNGIQGLQGESGSGTARRVTKVRCSARARRSGARMVCRFNRRARHSWLVQLRDRRGALSTARGNGKRTMVFLSQRRPRGTMRAFVIKGLRTSR